MINISLHWLPLIITFILMILTFIFSGFRFPENPLDTATPLGAIINFLFALMLCFDFVYYIILGVYWFFTHINFV